MKSLSQLLIIPFDTVVLLVYGNKWPEDKQHESYTAGL